MLLKFGLQSRYESMESLGKAFQENFNGMLQGFGQDDNTLGNVNGVRYKKQTNFVRGNLWSFDNEYTMATIMVLATGHHLIPERKEKGKKCVDSFAVLQTLQRIPKHKIQVIH
ncbi:hypothetical protein POM88_005118 [Heracleum sosnowskyi]|uniref:Uncharacterized protein n=1 Tax=Heracleum sosnowskyi TaxID=360622 RepID=A0AAD8NF11_9APIA|nr:hypothetical protein POM88_005118 [Heracleum sosnowskyi]